MKLNEERKLTRDERMYDERQLKVFMKIFRRGLVTAAMSLALNAMLRLLGIVWASVWGQNLLLSTLAVSVVFGEAHIRGVWFGKGHFFPRFVMIFLGICSLVLITISIVHFSKGEKYIDGGALTNSAVLNLQGLFYLIIAILALVQCIRVKREEEA